ncbi:Asp-tRNA(Asn)/Glu-tRNA(Gln) amidotransferase subunit GatC [Helicobacter didelphidarum]|uniref:Aspartyl/glutamyl-tRNA(Asn/Gln) amidotransferase subunit C n=1 Tax=Helicobacter didelphidarum TaxID=2040648 RepID=A0A3D8IBQ6_9HELI|nr:Asp-tRNA(Asn)/Glu-tRNA(Gln) amidotransferase subunit GatC [Helicobacter didelphidarum]RDU62475.1 Asp-tRNA(Asn)/Glu-tRNA(Gln) amidotransferase subunit GatC [Helicobacter didelphidarum]
MKVDDILLHKLEKLAMIQIQDSKREDFKNELTEIIAKMNSLQEVDTSNILLNNEQKTPMREDIPHNTYIRDDILSQAPKAQDGYFIVPKIL